MFENSNEQLLLSVAKALTDGKMSAEDASRLLNTIARCEERMIEMNHHTPHHTS